MRKLIAILFLVLLCGQSFSQVICYADYLVRQSDYIAKCINKQRPQLKCNGQCQMMKKMLEQEDKNQPVAPQLKINSMPEVISSRSSFLIIVPTPVFDYHYFNQILSVGKPIDRSYAHFHPPDFS